MIPAGVRIFVCIEPVDMRRGFDRLAQTARDIVGQDPQQRGALFVFANRRATRMKVLRFERNGYSIRASLDTFSGKRRLICARNWRTRSGHTAGL
jgi:transposase